MQLAYSPESWHQTRPGSPKPSPTSPNGQPRVVGSHKQPTALAPLLAGSSSYHLPFSPSLFSSQTAFWPFSASRRKRKDKAPQGGKESQTQGTPSRIIRIFPSLSFSLFSFPSYLFTRLSPSSFHPQPLDCVARPALPQTCAEACVIPRSGSLDNHPGQTFPVLFLVPNIL